MILPGRMKATLWPSMCECLGDWEEEKEAGLHCKGETEINSFFPVGARAAQSVAQPLDFA